MKLKSTPSAASRVLAVVALAAVLAACGRGEEQVTNAPAPATPSGSGVVVTPPPAESPEDRRMANAVVTGKTAAAIDLKYDVLARPQVGQPFEIELVLLPRLAADTLSVEVTGITGLTVVSGGAAKFESVTSGERHVMKVLVRADAAGLYYANVVARMVTQVQTDVRTFSVPVAVGTVPVVAKPGPAQDASGEAIESMPAVESRGEPAPKQ
jgi:hypothetical protein